MRQKKAEEPVFHPEWSKMRKLMHIGFWALFGILFIAFGLSLIYAVSAFSEANASFLTKTSFYEEGNIFFALLNDLGAFGSQFLGSLSYLIAICFLFFGFQSFKMRQRVSYKKWRALSLVLGFAAVAFLLGGIAHYRYDGGLQPNMISGFWGMLFFQQLYQIKNW